MYELCPTPDWLPTEGITFPSWLPHQISGPLRSEEGKKAGGCHLLRDTHRVGLALTRLLSHGRYYYCLPREEGAEAQHHPASKR